MSDLTPSVDPATTLTSAQDKHWASFAHFGGVLWFAPSLIIFLVFKDRGALTRQEAREALNWQISYTIAVVVLTFALSVVGTLLALTGAFPLALVLSYLPYALYLANVVFSIRGGVAVNAGSTYRYPVALRLIT